MTTARKFQIFLALILVLTSIGYTKEIAHTVPENVGISSEKLALVKPAVQTLVDKEKLAGAAVIVTRKGKIAMLETFGTIDKLATKPVQKDTIFRIYSMSKPITSVAIMILHEEGKLDIDDHVSKYIPSFKDQKVYVDKDKTENAKRPTSIRDLLRHTSGLTYGIFGNTPVDRQYRAAKILNRNTPLAETMEKLGKIPLQYQPGTKWHYSVSTDVLGYIVEKASGQPFDVFLKERIFDPLDMKDTGFFVPADKLDRFSACFGPKIGGGLRVTDDPANSRFKTKPAFLSGGGGLVSTGRDYLRFCQMLLNNGKLDNTKILKPKTVKMMRKNQLPAPVKRNQGFGLGFSIVLKDGKSPKGHYGWGGAASTHFWISPKDDLIVIALSQRMPHSSQLENAVKPIIYDSFIDRKPSSN